MKPDAKNPYGRPIRPRVETANIDIDLHGMTERAAIAATTRHIERAHTARLSSVKIIHGHGTGVLKRAVQRLLRSSPLVKKHYAASTGEGAFGATIAELDYGQRGSYDGRESYGVTPRAERRR